MDDPKRRDVLKMLAMLAASSGIPLEAAAPPGSDQLGKVADRKILRRVETTNEISTDHLFEMEVTYESGVRHVATIFSSHVNTSVGAHIAMVHRNVYYANAGETKPTQTFMSTTIVTVKNLDVDRAEISIRNVDPWGETTAGPTEVLRSHAQLPLTDEDLLKAFDRKIGRQP